MKIWVLLLSFIVFFNLTGLCQTKVRGRYFKNAGMMHCDLKIKRNHTFKLLEINWETGSGALHYGKWTLKNDTLVLEYKKFRPAHGLSRGRERISFSSESETKTETLFVSGENLCFVLPVNDNCYKKK